MSATPALVSASAHPPDGLVNTYAAPLLKLGQEPALNDLAPTTIVPPSLLTDTEYPNCARCRVARVSFADCDHPRPDLVNTYADPTSRSLNPGP